MFILGAIVLVVGLVVYSVYMHLHIVNIRKRLFDSITDDDSSLLTANDIDHGGSVNLSREAAHA